MMSTLSSLFVVSASAKVFALENGFLESIIEEIKDVHVKLNLASLQLEKDSGDKRKVRFFSFLCLSGKQRPILQVRAFLI